MLLYHLLRTLSLVPCCYFCCPITEPDNETINQFITRKQLSTFLSKCPLMMTWLAVTRSLQLDMANLVTTQDLLFRSHTLSVLSWLPLTTRVVSPINLADNTLPECPSYYVLHICVLIKNFIHVPVKVCLSLESSTDQTLVAKSLLAPRIILPT